MERSEVWTAIDDERRTLVHLLEDLSEQEWRRPSLCEGWTVRQVAAHLALQNTTWSAMPRAVLGLVRHGGMNGAIHAMACRHAELPAEAIVGEIRDRIGVWRSLPAVTFRETAIDYLVHGQDIAVPLGRTLPMPTGLAVLAADRVWSSPRMFRARKKLADYRLVADDAPWAAGQGHEISGPIGALLLLLTGRLAALPQLSGPGVAGLRGLLTPSAVISAHRATPARHPRQRLLPRSTSAGSSSPPPHRGLTASTSRPARSAKQQMHPAHRTNQLWIFSILTGAELATVHWAGVCASRRSSADHTERAGAGVASILSVESEASGLLHHVELWVPDLGRGKAQWGWLLGERGYQQFQDWPAGCSWRLGVTYLIEQSPAMSAAEHDRLPPGLNHLGFHAGARQRVDALAAAAPSHGWTLLFADKHPYAGGEDHYAAYLANTDGYEVELIAE